MRKEQALAIGRENLYEIIESHEGALGLVSTMETLADISSKPQNLETVSQVSTICKAFADRAWGGQARAVLLEVWDGNLSDMIKDFWDKPDKYIQARLAAAKWANSMEGISDLRRIWGVRPQEVSTDELSAFQHTLPADAASTLATSEYRAPLEVIMSARQADYLRLRLRQAAGQKGKLPDNESMVSLLRKQGTFGKETEATAELIKREREYQRQLKIQKDKDLKSQ